MRARSLFVPLLSSWAALVGCAPVAPARLAWTPPPEVETLSAKGEASSSPGDRTVAIEAGGLAFIDAAPGERVRIVGAARIEDLTVGIATRDADPAGAITWLEGDPIPGGLTFQVPAWAPSSTVVVRSAAAAKLSVAVAEPTNELLAWERFEEDAALWTRGDRPDPPAAPSGAMDPAVRFVAAMRSALGPRSATDAGRAWLSLALVQEGFVTRPLTRLVFPWAPVSVRGGQDVTRASSPLVAADRTVRRRVSAGGDLDIAAPDADVVRLEIASGVDPVRVVLSAAGVPVRTVQIAGAARRPTPVHVRLVVPSSGALRAHVEQGEATIGVLAYQHRPGLREKWFLRYRDPARLADLASQDRSIGALARAAIERDAASFRALGEAAKSAGEPGTEAVLRTLATSFAPDAKTAVEEARAAFSAIASLPPQVAWPLARRVAEALLERRPAIEAAFPNGPGLVEPAAQAGGEEDDRIAVRTALAILDPRGPIRPEAAAFATRFALRDTSREDWAARARLAWQTEVGWRPLPVNGASDVQTTWAVPQPEIGAPEGMCATFAGGSPRWTRLSPGTRSLPASAPDGATHAVVPIRAETLQSLAAGAFRVDKVAVPVHASIGLASIVAVSAGPHDFSLAEGSAPVLVRVPREGLAPCAELRRMDRWALASGEVTVDVPPGPVETVVRLSLRRASGTADKPIRLDIGSVRAEVARFEGDVAIVEAPIRVTAGPIAITPSAPVWMRVEVRARAERKAPLPLALPTAPDEDALLAAVRAATRALAAAKDDDARRTALKERATALAALGFRRLAVVDAKSGAALPTNAGGASTTGGAALSNNVSGASTSGGAAPSNNASGASTSGGAALSTNAGGATDAGGGAANGEVDPRDVEPPDDVLARVLPAGAPSVIPLNVPAQIEVLPAPADPAALAPIVERFAGGDPAGAAALLAGVPEPPHPDESTLLRAIVAERARVFEPAARAYGALALEADRHVAAARAALAYADLSLLKADPDTALVGYLFAKRAQQHGADARAPMGRLDPAVTFVRPDTAGAAGHTWVERDGQDPRLIASLVERVRRAYLDAPEDATVLEGDERVMLRVAPKEASQLVIEDVCALTDPAPPAGAACRLAARVDGSIVPCEGSPARCTVAVSKGKHRIEIALESPVDRVGWARLQWSAAPPDPKDASKASAPKGTSKPIAPKGTTKPPAGAAASDPKGATKPPAGAAASDPKRASKSAATQIAADVAGRLSPKSAARWLETDGARPLTLGFVGPTLIRVDARGTPGRSERLDVRVDGVSQATLDLDAPADPAAVRRDIDGDDERALRAPQAVEVIVMAPGAHALEIRSAGRALVLPSFAVARGLPRPTVVPVTPSPRPAPGDPIAPLPRPLPVIADDPPPGPVSIAAETALVLDRINDASVPADDAGRYLETSVFARRRFLDGLFFGRVGLLARARTGIPTFGADARVDFNVPIGSPLPRVFVEGTLFGQQGASAFDVTAGMHSGVWWQFEPRPGLGFVPTIGVDLSSAPLADVQRYPNLARLDPDVYFRYDAPRPVEPFVTFLTSYRPTMDSIVRLRLGAHIAGIEGVDDVFAYPSIDIAPGRGIAPALTLGYALSYHFASSSISESYLRHRVDFSAFFWRWVQASHRVSASATALLQVGSPFNDEPDLRLIFALGYDYTMGRGVSDYSPLEMQFRERFDEDSGRIQRRTPRTEDPPSEPSPSP